MKILQVTTNYPCKENPIFGIFMKEQVESVEKYGVENRIFFSNGITTDPNKKNSGAKVHLKSAFKLMWHLLWHRYDVIHCHNVIGGLIVLLSGGLFFNRKHTVISLQNDPEHQGNKDNRFIPYLLPRVAKVIVKKPISSNSPKYIYLPNGVNTELFNSIDKAEAKMRLGLDASKKYILFVDSNVTKGRTEKRIDRFYDTLKVLEDEYGYTDLEPLVMTKTPRQEVPYWMNACELYLLTSDEEASPNAVKECMACNIPVVSTPVGSIPDLFNGVEECRMAADFEPRTLAKEVNLVLKNEGAKNIRAAIFEKGLDMDSIARRLKTVYDEISR